MNIQETIDKIQQRIANDTEALNAIGSLVNHAKELEEKITKLTDKKRINYANHSSRKNIGLDDIAGSASHVALFNGDPSGAGTEISGGSYARQSITWNAASAGNLDSSNHTLRSKWINGKLCSVIHSAHGGTCLSFKAITSETFATEGSLVISDFDVAINDV